MKYLFQYLAFSVVGLFLFACGSYPVNNSEKSKEKPVIIKGCSDQKVPLLAYSVLLEKLQLEAKSIMFGEACSSVPIYKSSNKF